MADFLMCDLARAERAARGAIHLKIIGLSAEETRAAINWGDSAVALEPSRGGGEVTHLLVFDIVARSSIEHDDVGFEVVDNRSGIPTADLERVFVRHGAPFCHVAHMIKLSKAVYP